MQICKLCGAVIPVHIYGLTLMQSRIYGYVAKNPNCRMKDIIAFVYHDDPNGGPVYAAASVHVQIHKINKRLVGKRIKAKIRASSGGRGATYRLLTLDAPMPAVIAPSYRDNFISDRS